MDYPTVDGKRASEVTFENVSLGADALLGEEGQALPHVEAVLDEARAALCAEAGGVLSELVRQTVDYTKQRKQFGLPISSFQVLQHRMVDMFIAAEQSVSMTFMATLKLDLPPAERSAAVSAAKAYVGRACTSVGQAAVQIHGGIGLTEELPLSHYFKRATMIEQALGSSDFHLRRYQALRPESAAGGLDDGRHLIEQASFETTAPCRILHQISGADTRAAPARARFLVRQFLEEAPDETDADRRVPTDPGRYRGQPRLRRPTIAIACA